MEDNLKHNTLLNRATDSNLNTLHRHTVNPLNNKATTPNNRHPWDTNNKLLLRDLVVRDRAAWVLVWRRSAVAVLLKRVVRLVLIASNAARCVK
jgi:hypothetical protein